MHESTNARLRPHLRWFLALAAVFFASWTHAATLYVPDTHSTIQAAVDAAASGDTILVKPGTYRENISIYNKELTLRSLKGKEPTILDGGGQGTVVSISTDYQYPHYRYGVTLEGLRSGTGSAARPGASSRTAATR